MYAIVQVALASLLGSLHCVGMCGPLVAFAVGDTGGRSWAGRAVVLGLYHGGRLVAYALIGAACGLLGAGMDSAAARVGLYRAASIAAGAMMIAVGTIAVLQASGMRLPRLPASGVMRGVIVGAQRAALALRPYPRALCVGLLTALLPCGWLYVFAIGAAGTGSPIRGMLVMAAFWIGTLPSLLLLGLGIQTLAASLGRRLPALTALVIVAFGISTLALRMQLPAETWGTHPSGISAGPGESLDPAEPPCCRHSAARELPADSRAAPEPDR